MIESFSCKNFKCFYDSGNIEIAPITLLVGPNNSGKSSLIKALSMLSQTAHSEDKNIYLRPITKDFDFGTYRDLIYKHQEDNNMSFTITTNRKYFSRYFDDESNNINGDQLTLSLTYGYLKKRHEIFLDSLSLIDEKGTYFTLKENKYSKRTVVSIRGLSEASNKLLSNCFVKRGMIYDFRPHPEMFDKINDGWQIAHAIDMILFKFALILKNIQHLGPLRMAPSRSYLFSGEVTDKIGGTGERALLNYAAMSKRGIRKEIDDLKKVNESLYKLGFISKFEYKKVGERHYEYWAEHPESGLSANLADIGFGASQVLPILMMLYAGNSDSLILIEQPEIHLHPAGQAELGSIFVDALDYKKNKLIIETHSENLIIRLLTEIAKKKLSPSDIAFYYVQPSPEIHEIIKIPVNEKGEFLTEWPKGFFEEGYNESIKLTKARSGIE